MLLGGEKRYRIRVDDLIILLKTQNILCGIAKKKKKPYMFHRKSKNKDQILTTGVSGWKNYFSFPFLPNCIFKVTTIHIITFET